MTCHDVIALLRARQDELEALGVARLSVFGSVARGDARTNSDVDLVARLSEMSQPDGFGYFGRIDALTRQLTAILGCPVDLVIEPIRKTGLRLAIEREAARAF